MSSRLGVDVGGTFTDFALVDERSGDVHIWKVPSTPRDPSEAMADGTTQLLRAQRIRPQEVAYLGHGTTVGTNAVLQRSGPRTALLTSRGFRDLLEIARYVRPDVYDFNVDRPTPLVPRRWRFEMPERLAFDGSPVEELGEGAVREVARQLASEDVGAVAICFLFSYVNSAHERLAKRVLEERLPGIAVAASHEVLPERREYERTSTTVLNAYLMPVLGSYFGRLRCRVRECGIQVEPYVTQSNGGVVSAAAAADRPVSTILSGPSAGVVGAVWAGQLAGFSNLITFDMGGTSTDVSLVRNGSVTITSDRSVGGLPARVPAVDVHAIGAGGGSLAWIDTGGLLKVGPHSAGADPGPACYGHGGTKPTVTDANVVLGRLNPQFLLGGRMAIDAAAARAAIERELAKPLGMEPIAAARGVMAVIESNMEGAVRLVSVERGHDPRDYVLVAFGGAGPLHAASLARKLGISKVLIPPQPGALCALGLLVTDLRADFVHTRVVPATAESAEAVNAVFAELEARAREWLTREAVPADRQSLLRALDMHYLGQRHELPVPVPHAPLSGEEVAALALAFQRRHQEEYGHGGDRPVMIASFRVTAIGAVPRPRVPFVAPDPGAPPPQPREHRQSHFDEAGGFVACPVYERVALHPGVALAGPAIVEQMDATTVIPPGAHAEVDGYSNLIVYPDGTPERQS